MWDGSEMGDDSTSRNVRSQRDLDTIISRTPMSCLRSIATTTTIESQLSM